MTTLDLRFEDAECTLWLAGCPSYRALPTAAVGRFRCETAEAGRELLGRVARAAAARGLRYLVGPLDGDTWHGYRLVVESDGSPPFLLEPANPAFWPGVFEAAGFTVIGRYRSARAALGAMPPRGSAAYARRLADAGIRVRRFDPGRAEDELRAIYRLSLTAFAANFLYTPIAEADFLDLYRPLLGRLVPEWVRLAEAADGELLAFLFALPDLAQGPAPDRLILKTYASRFPGLGGHLADRLHADAAACGLTSVIHALMHEDNASRRYSERTAAQVFRRYALYGRPLPP